MGEAFGSGTYGFGVVTVCPSISDRRQRASPAPVIACFSVTHYL